MSLVNKPLPISCGTVSRLRDSCSNTQWLPFPLFGEGRYPTLRITDTNSARDSIGNRGMLDGYGDFNELNGD